MSHKIFVHVQNFRDYFAPLGDTCEEITNHWRLFQDCFATHSRCLLPAVAKQSQSSEIGALVVGGGGVSGMLRRRLSMKKEESVDGGGGGESVDGV